jgi:hypothetical protein
MYILEHVLIGTGHTNVKVFVVFSVYSNLPLVQYIIISSIARVEIMWRSKNFHADTAFGPHWVGEWGL